MFRRSTFELRTVDLPSDRRKTSRKKLRLVTHHAISRARNTSHAPPRPPAMSMPLKIQCRLCLAMREGCHDGFNGENTGAACRDCAKTGHACLSKAQHSWQNPGFQPGSTDRV
ncbi:hypothetical protein BDP55DRAFT_687603 [Colletotrichum godetiae]|uniref:Uncharacterized protein n=1 Tax=Colletotrichum godetiae TaxID=1209918 RepID=A0AAJ0EPX0_9PEZI|nr:uncharacterized protein BDP55DRAFT_687603 [Colletotrichum godetiae]KAK1656898.1 hypothetical protein BDP55DRAFT_687603 [Colletotrichum godetiae]